MKRVLAGLLILGLAACGDDDDESVKVGENGERIENPTVFLANDDGGTFADASFIKVTIDGMPCIIYKDAVGHHKSYSGLTCDWSQR